MKVNNILLIRCNHGFLTSIVSLCEINILTAWHKGKYEAFSLTLQG